MNIIDTFPQIANCFADDIFNMEYWENYANAISPGLAAKCKEDIADYDGLTEKIQDTLQKNCNGSIIFYLGLCNSAGWATELDGNPVILLGVEKIIELSWYHKSDMAGLIYHELGHIWHNQTRLKIRKPFQNQDLWQLYCEGMAMLSSRTITVIGNTLERDSLIFSFSFSSCRRKVCLLSAAGIEGNLLLRLEQEFLRQLLPEDAQKCLRILRPQRLQSLCYHIQDPFPLLADRLDPFIRNRYNNLAVILKVGPALDETFLFQMIEKSSYPGRTYSHTAA